MGKLRSLHSDFAGAIPTTDEDIDQALGTGLISLDANVLLSFYRYSPSARSALLDVLRAAGDRVWVSHQAVREFWRNRCHAIDDRSRSTLQAREQLDRSQRSAESALVTWAKQIGVSEKVRAQVLAALEHGYSQVTDLIEAEIDQEDAISYDVTNDAVYNELSSLLADHVGEPMAADIYAEAVAEGRRRAELGLPPGFKDVAKETGDNPEGASGDYLVWKQSILEAGSRGLGLILVTADEKDDWWWRHRGRLLGPRAELVAEFSPCKLTMLRPSQLLQHAAALNVAVAEGAAEDLARASSAEDNPTWTQEALEELLKRLDADGYVQAEVIREAAAGGGQLERERIYELGDYDDDRMLRGFTRPSARITRYLQDEGWLDLGVQPALRPAYESGVLATRFLVPMEFVELLSGVDDSPVPDGVSTEP